jgi:predicted phosphodiesterase
MSHKNPVATAIVDEMLAKYPDLPSAQLARIIYKDNPTVFSTQEVVRTAIRYRRGASGKTHRESVGLEENITPEYKIPKSCTRAWSPFIMDGVNKVAILSDIHVPYHTEEAIECAVKRAKKEEVDGIILNGDTIDCHALSQFIRDPRARSFKQERETTNELLAYLRQEFPTQRIVWRDGNHEDRFKAYMMQKAPEVYDEKFFSIDKLLNFEDLDIEYVTDKRIIMLGGLAVMHGHEFHKGFAPPVNPARGAYLKAKQSVMVGHHHRTSEHTETALDGTMTTTWSVGCLSDLHPAYSPYNSYNHGSAIVSLVGNYYEVSNYRIVNGRALN